MPRPHLFICFALLFALCCAPSARAQVPVSLVFTPNPTVYGEGTNGILTLSSPAPSGGVTVAIVDNGQTYTVPMSAGQTQLAIDEEYFSVSGSAVSVTATLNGVTVSASIGILPVPASVTFSPSLVTAGQSASVTVTLSNPAPEGGQVVSLTQDGADAGTLLVPAGQKSASYTLSTATPGTIQVTASCNGYAASGSLTVATPTPVPVSLVFSPNPVTVGQTTTATVTLSGPVPAGGQDVAITQDGQPFLTVTVAAGQTSATFWTSYYNGYGGRTFQITAACNGVSVTTPLSVVAVPVKPVALSFSPGTVMPGATTTGTVTVSDAAASAGQVVTLTLNGGSAGTVTVPAGTNHATFPLTPGPELAGQTVTVMASCGGGGASASLIVAAPAPTLTSISPATATAGTSGVSITLSGTGFISRSVAQWNGFPLPTTFVSSTQLTASVPANDLTRMDWVPVTVSTPGPGGGTSGAVTFTVVETRPVATGLSPSSAVAGNAGFTLTVMGANFTPTCAVLWNGAALPTTYLSPTQLTASVTAALITTGGSLSILVQDTQTGIGATTGVAFTVVNPVPALSGLSPASASVGGAAVTLTVNGSNFVPKRDGFAYGSAVLWNGGGLTTTFVSATQLTATVPASLLASAGTAQVTVSNSGPGGGSSVALPFTVLNNRPTVSSVSPSTVTAGGPDFTLSVTGANYTPTCAVTWGGVTLTTTYVSATQLTATVPAFYILGGGIGNVSVKDTATGVISPSAGRVTINNPVPTLSAITPSTAVAGSSTLTLTVTGTDFTRNNPNFGGGYLAGSTVYWNGQRLITLFNSPTQLTATVQPSMLAAAGTAQVTVVNPTPGGGTSNALPFAITAPPDTTAPVTTASLLGTAGTNGWYTSGVQVTLAATDNASGVARTFYTLDAGPQQTYSVPFAISTDGTHKLAFWSVDNAGNTEVINTQTVKIDSTAPTLAFGAATPAANAAGWNSTAVQVPYTASDALSGVASATPGSPVHFADEGANQTQTVTVTDNAGNSASFTSPVVNIDLTAPITTASVSGATVTLSATDALSGVAGTTYTIDGGAQQTYSVPFTVTGSGTHTVQFWSVDGAGNTEAAKTQSVFVDTTPPTTTASLSGTAGTNGWFTSPVMVTLSAADPDGAADVASTVYALDGGSQQTYSAPFTVIGNGTHSVTFASMDRAGNAETVNTLAVKIDGIAPATTASVSGATVTLTAADALSGVASTTFAIDGGAQQMYAAPFTVTGGGPHAVSYFSMDNAGNTETAHSVTVTVAAVKPVLNSLSPTSVTAGGPDFTLTVNGTGFALNSIVKWNGAEEITSYISPTLLTASIPASLIAAAGKATVTVVTPKVATSGTKTFTINPPPSVTLSAVSLNPATVKGGTQNATGTVTLSTPATVSTTLTFASSNAAITFPASTVTVPVGASTATFRAYSHKVTSTKTVTVTATLNGASKTANITVTP